MINLILASDELVFMVVKCTVHGIEYRFNYRVIKIIFDIAVLERAIE